MEIIVCSLLILTSWFGYKKYKKLLNPITIFVTWSLAVLLLGLCSNIFKTDYCEKTYAILFVSYVVYIVGVLFGDRLKTRDRNEDDINYRRLRECIIIISLIVDVCICLYFIDLMGNIGIVRIFANLSGFNLTIQEGYFTGKLYYQIMFLSIPLSMYILLFFLKERIKHRYIYILQFIICFLPYFTVRRDTLFKMVLLNALLWYLLTIYKPGKNNISSKFKRLIKIACLVVIVISFFSITQKMLNKSMTITNAKLLEIQIPNILIDPLSYLLGSFTYFDRRIILNQTGFVAPLISTLRIPIKYLQSFVGGSIDVTTPFALEFLNIGSNVSIYFNTAPIQYYTIIELGFAFPIFYFVLGTISGCLYKMFRQNQGIRETTSVVILFSLLFWSIREYILIYLSTWIMIISVIVLNRIIATRRGS